MEREKLETANFCECGCGQVVKPGRRFVRGHNARTDMNPSKGSRGRIPWNKGITKKDDPRVGRKQGIKIIVQCDACGKELKRNPCHINRKKTEYNFCNKKCQSLFKKPQKLRDNKKRLELVLDPNIKCHWCDKPANYRFSTGTYCCEDMAFKCSGCSTHSGAENGMYGKKHKDESKQLMSENNPMKQIAVVKKVSDALMGKKKSPEHCQAISEGKKGKYTGPDSSMYGKKQSEEFKEAKSKFMLENNPMEYIDFSGEKNPFYGKKHTEKSLAIMSAKTSLEKHPRWRGGSSFEPYGIEFNEKLREEIRKRDGYECQFCGRTAEQNLKDFGCKLHVHHIDYDKDNSKENNLITLCKSCHSHTYTSRGFWQQFYQDLIDSKDQRQAVNL